MTEQVLNVLKIVLRDFVPDQRLSLNGRNRLHFRTVMALRDGDGLFLLRFVNHAHRKFPTRPLTPHPRRSTEASSTIQPSPVRLWWSCG